MLRALLFVIALGSGAVSAWLVAAMPAQETPAAPEAPPPAQLEEVLVAARPGDQGSQLLADQLRWQPWPADALSPSFILRSQRPEAPKELSGSVLRARVVPGEPIFPGKLAPPGASYLSAVLSPGMRAVAIPISAERTAGGFVLPNDRVDVMLAVPCRPQDDCQGTMTVRTVLTNVRVLAIDQSGAGTRSEGVLVGKTATLELDPEQAQTLIAAAASGTLSLVLRSASDHDQQQQAVEEKTKESIRIWRKGVGEYVILK